MRCAHAVLTDQVSGGAAIDAVVLRIGGYRSSTYQNALRSRWLSDDGRLVVVFNGEIYNYPALRKELEADGVRFRTTSDTEALLHLYARHGTEMVHRLRGMFALAIWDEARRGLFLARDPYGIKPLYTANDGWTFRFASQVKALLAGGRVSRDPEPAGVVGFHLFGSVPEPFTLYREIRSVPAGHTQWIDAAGPREPKPFANLAAILAEGARSPSPPAELPQRVRAAVLDSVRAHLLADVEVGVFLSAGIDSGALLGLMRDASPTMKSGRLRLPSMSSVARRRTKHPSPKLLRNNMARVTSFAALANASSRMISPPS